MYSYRKRYFHLTNHYGTLHVSINDIHENVLNEKQLKIKQQILANRKYFESSKMDDYIAFKQGLLNEVKKTKKINLNYLNSLN